MVAEYVIPGFEIFSSICIMAYLNNKEVRLNRNTILLILIDVFLMVKANEMGTIYPVIVVYLLLFMYSGLEYGFYLRKMVIHFVLTILLVSTLQVTAMLVVALPGKLEVLQTKELLLINIIVLISVITWVKQLQIYRISRVLQEQDWLTFLIVIGVGACLIGYVFSFKVDMTLKVSEYVIVFISVLYICLMTTAWKYYKNVAVERAVEMKTANLYSLAYRNMIEDIRAKQHDFDNHLSAIVSQHYICRDYDTLVHRQKEYIQMTQNNNKYNKLLWSGDSVLVGFLYGKCLEAEKKNVEVDYKVHGAQVKCSVPEYQIISLMGNLFDNALEAVENYEHKKIHVLVEQNDSDLIIEVANPCQELNRNEIALFFKKNYSRKGEKRGYGLYNVKKICDQYGIEILCEEQVAEEIHWISFRLVIKK